jgi:hypothetical protein
MFSCTEGEVVDYDSERTDLQWLQGHRFHGQDGHSPFAGVRPIMWSCGHYSVSWVGVRSRCSQLADAWHYQVLPVVVVALHSHPLEPYLPPRRSNTYPRVDGLAVSAVSRRP